MFIELLKDKIEIYSKTFDEKIPAYQARAYHAESRMEALQSLNIDSKTLPHRLSGIVCTIGPATREVPKLVQLIKAGMNVARMNFSHGNHEYHLGTLKNVREAAKIVGQEVGDPNFTIPIALDTKGPEIRTGLLEKGSGDIELVKGKTIHLTTNEAFKEKCTAEILYVDYKNIVKVLSKGMRVFIDDGLISLVVKEITKEHIHCEIENGGKIGSKKGINLPNAMVDLPAVSEQDQKDLIFGCKNQLDMIFASFIRNAQGVKAIREILKQNKSEYIKIISKIENHEGVQKVDEIIRESDGIMVARGDMGIEIPPPKVVIAQKMLIAKCNMMGKPVICATQMLESMITKPRPTRAEVSDVANAIFDGSDCVMLSGETAKGDYPIECVSMMHSIVLEAESALPKNLFTEIRSKQPTPCDTSIASAIAVVEAATKAETAAIVVVAITSDGLATQLISKYRPRCPIIMVTEDSRIARQSHLYRGILPYVFGKNKSHEKKPGTPPTGKQDLNKYIASAIEYGKNLSILKPKDTVVLVTGSRHQAIDTIRLIEV